MFFCLLRNKRITKKDKSSSERSPGEAQLAKSKSHHSYNFMSQLLLNNIPFPGVPLDIKPHVRWHAIALPWAIA